MSAARLETVPRRWPGETVVVAAPGPSLSREVCDRCRAYRAIAVQDAWRLMPWADVLYGCDSKWWRHHNGAPDFAGERWASHGTTSNDNAELAGAYGLHLVAGRSGATFSTDPRILHYGFSSGFQAVNLAILFGATRIVLIGFDMRIVDGRAHYFGDHPPPLLRRTNYGAFAARFVEAAKRLPPGVEIVNATPGSALTCFPMVPLDEVLAGRDVAGRTAA